MRLCSRLPTCESAKTHKFLYSLSISRIRTVDSLHDSGHRQPCTASTLAALKSSCHLLIRSSEKELKSPPLRAEECLGTPHFPRRIPLLGHLIRRRLDSPSSAARRGGDQPGFTAGCGRCVWLVAKSEMIVGRLLHSCSNASVTVRRREKQDRRR